ncbi:hypothetical protein [Tateyamaria sp. syn59]|uniref:hypothetical protein n=1 Tax=Tateyamaria sp. syn59 TaxID=2576942 RepID=UPI0011BE1555|nr:hypothetical protein [Tateyamaria sp. syn59]
MFKQIEGDNVLLQTGGVYKVCQLYTNRVGQLFAGYSGGYVRLKANGSTSKDRLNIEMLETELELCQDKLGRLGTSSMPDAKPLQETQRNGLLLEAT